MTKIRCVILIALIFLSSSALRGQASESSINKQLQKLSIVQDPMMPPGPPDASRPTAIPDAQRPATIVQTAKDIDGLPAGGAKVKLATTLAQITMGGESGSEALHAAADTLAQALTQTPQQPGKDGLPSAGYMDLAKIERYAQIQTSLKDPQLTKAEETVAANEIDVSKADFTLKDLNGKKVTLSALKGKIVLVNFWSMIDCAACHSEMQNLDLIYTHYQSQGLVVLSITGDNPFNVSKFLAPANYHAAVLSDDGGKVAKMFHVDGVPRTFVFDRDGKLVAESMGMSTQRQFFAMLGKAGLQPGK
jgi:peroxiredoxin